MTASDANSRDLAKLEQILRWAKKARDLAESPRWKTDARNVIDDHGEACEAVWAGLNQLLDIRESRGNPVSPIQPPPDYKKQTRRLLVAALKKSLPSILQDAVEAALDDIEL